MRRKIQIFFQKNSGVFPCILMQIYRSKHPRMLSKLGENHFVFSHSQLRIKISTLELDQYVNLYGPIQILCERNTFKTEIMLHAITLVYPYHAERLVHT